MSVSGIPDSFLGKMYRAGCAHIVFEFSFLYVNLRADIIHLKSDVLSFEVSASFIVENKMLPIIETAIV